MSKTSPSNVLDANLGGPSFHSKVLNPTVATPDRLRAATGGSTSVDIDGVSPINQHTRLWQSVVLQAFYDALLDERPPGRRHKWSTVAATSSSNVPTVKDRARFWLLECGKDFADVCGFAGMDPEAVRAMARRMLRDETSVTKARAIFAAERKKTSEGAGAEVRALLGDSELRDRGDVPQG